MLFYFTVMFDTSQKIKQFYETSKRKPCLLREYYLLIKHLTVVEAYSQDLLKNANSISLQFSCTNSL